MARVKSPPRHNVQTSAAAAAKKRSSVSGPGKPIASPKKPKQALVRKPLPGNNRNPGWVQPKPEDADEMLRLWEKFELSIDRKAFELIVQEIVLDMGSNVAFYPETIYALQHATEERMVQIFKDAETWAQLVNERDEVHLRDFQQAAEGVIGNFKLEEWVDIETGHDIEKVLA
ncbi:MAG: hypothetical protein M1816_004663 [Peltula sp. TS41687]|nr:MAG: hypothetical protein M1816_004663 [Peltula sp. TS41687]